MNLDNNEWVIVEVATRQMAVLDEVLREVNGYAKFELSGLEEKPCMTITAIIPSKNPKSDWHFYKSIFFYQGEEFTDNLQFRNSINRIGDLITEIKAKIPNWKEELGL